MGILMFTKVRKTVQYRAFRPGPWSGPRAVLKMFPSFFSSKKCRKGRGTEHESKGICKIVDSQRKGRI